MELLYLAHRLPYPPDKGDKVRSYHLLRHLAARHRVHLGTFIDDPRDVGHLPLLAEWCVDTCVLPLSPRWARLASLRGFFTGEALSLPYYYDVRLSHWVAATLKQWKIDAAVVFSSVMAQYVLDEDVPLVVDFVDMDSTKWHQYAERHRWPLSWLYRREGERLFAFERCTANAARHSFFVTPAERQLFVTAAPETADKVSVMANGVDADFFAPTRSYPSPYSSHEVPLVFTGAMDYLPNVDAVAWFVSEVLPEIARKWPAVRFYVVGRNPVPAVRALSGERVVITGTVADVRPYLAHAAIVVAPLRIARGIQNKILEAMAMAKAVVASAACARPIDAAIGKELLQASQACEFIAQIDTLLGEPQRAMAIGTAARAAVLERYSWAAHLTAIDQALAEVEA